MAENINFSKITINMDAERECDMNMYALRKKRNLNLIYVMCDLIRLWLDFFFVLGPWIFLTKKNVLFYVVKTRECFTLGR